MHMSRASSIPASSLSAMIWGGGRGWHVILRVERYTAAVVVWIAAYTEGRIVAKKRKKQCQPGGRGRRPVTRLSVNSEEESRLHLGQSRTVDRAQARPKRPRVVCVVGGSVFSSLRSCRFHRSQAERPRVEGVTPAGPGSLRAHGRAHGRANGCTRALPPIPAAYTLSLVAHKNKATK